MIRFIDQNGKRCQVVRIQTVVVENGRKVLYSLRSVRSGKRLIWQGVRSCFGSGKWIGRLPWLGKDAWKGR